MLVQVLKIEPQPDGGGIYRLTHGRAIIVTNEQVEGWAWLLLDDDGNTEATGTGHRSKGGAYHTAMKVARG